MPCGAWVSSIRFRLPKLSALRRNYGWRRCGPLPPHLFSSYSAAMPGTIYKICPETLWREAERAGGSRAPPSTSPTASSIFPPPLRSGRPRRAIFPAKRAPPHRAGRRQLGPALKYEPSRGGALFPHLYVPLDPTAAIWVKPLPLKSDGSHDSRSCRPDAAFWTARPAGAVLPRPGDRARAFDYGAEMRAAAGSSRQPTRV